jgi:hypothetical protein
LLARGKPGLRTCSFWITASWTTPSSWACSTKRARTPIRNAAFHVSGVERAADGRLIVGVGQDQTRELRLSAQVAAAMVPEGPVKIEVKATETATGASPKRRGSLVPPNR